MKFIDLVNTLRFTNAGNLSKWRAFGPTIVGATGGSGTRVFAQVLQAAGMYIGTNHNEALDILDFGEFSDRWVNDYLTGNVESLMASDLNQILKRQLAHAGKPRIWGWKQPRSIYLLPFYEKQLPGFKFIHVVRDGRDMAYSTKTAPMMKHASAKLGKELDPSWSTPMKMMALWSEVNMQAADFGANILKERYLLIRFEDLCAQPIPTIEKMLTFIGLQFDAASIAQIPVPPQTIGRWQMQEKEELEKVLNLGEHALKRFDYWN